MNMDNLYYMGELNDSPLELPQYSTLATPCPMPEKPRHQQKKSSTGRLTIRAPQYPDDVPGSIDFDFVVNLSDAPSICTYSKKIKKIFLMMNHPFRLKFNWTPKLESLFLRSAIVFCDDYHRTTPVQRCYAHMGPELPQNAGVTYDQLRHVFGVSDSANLYRSKYEVDSNGFLTTRTMLRAEVGEAWIDYQFFCQNSCPTGINRRSTKMVFLIEDSTGVVFAKRSILIHICTNPKRDMARADEIRIPSKKRKAKKKRKQQSPLPPPPPIKSPDTCDDDETVYSLNIDVLGEENYRAVLKYAYDVMAAKAIRTGNHQLLKPHMDAILSKEQLTDH